MARCIITREARDVRIFTGDKSRTQDSDNCQETWLKRQIKSLVRRLVKSAGRSDKKSMKSVDWGKFRGIRLFIDFLILRGWWTGYIHHIGTDPLPYQNNTSTKISIFNKKNDEKSDEKGDEKGDKKVMKRVVKWWSGELSGDRIQ